MTRRRRYAKETTVTVASSRNQIDDLLTRWGADQLQWSQDNKGGKAMLRFIWEHDGTSYCARFEIKVPTEKELEEESVDLRNGEFSQTKYDKALKRRGMVEHRELFLLLKAMFVAVDSGLIKAEQILLPFLEDKSGMTIADVLLPQLPKIQGKGGVKLLMEGKR